MGKAKQPTKETHYMGWVGWNRPYRDGGWENQPRESKCHKAPLRIDGTDGYCSKCGLHVFRTVAESSYPRTQELHVARIPNRKPQPPRKFLCIGGPLPGSRKPTDDPHTFTRKVIDSTGGYHEYNWASGGRYGWGKRRQLEKLEDDLRRCIFIHESLLEPGIKFSLNSASGA